MKKIVIGRAGKNKAEIDLDILIRTRLLIQANSGGGKSWLLRRLAEQLFGKIPVHIVDWEGEFATLREKHGYVLVGKGGETPADPRSAELVAHKLLELRASAVLDLYDLKPEVRHHWVKLYLDAIVNAPKRLWRPTIFILDEAHIYAPEKGQGESEAYGSVIDLVTRGRKRGFCPILATQRLSKLSKNVSGEMLNRLVGMTFEDVDLVRAADLLSVPRPDRNAFFKEMKLLEPGKFYGLGRAIAKDRTMITVGKVTTTHPEPGMTGYSDAPPPAPSKVRAMFPKLQDLPQEAEAKARTEREFRQEIRELKAQLRKQPKPSPAVLAAPAPQVKTVEIPVISKKQEKLVQGMIVRLERAAGKLSKVSALEGEIRGVMDTIGGALSNAVEAAENLHKPKPRYLRAIGAPPVRPAPRSPVSAIKPVRQRASPAGNGNPEVKLDKCPRAILKVLAFEADSGRRDGCEIGKIALLSRYRISGGFKNSLAGLRTRGLMEGLNTGRMTITQEGLDAVGDCREVPPQGDDLARYWLDHPSFGVCEKKILGTLLACDTTGPPYGLTIGELAKATNYAVSGGFKNALSSLRTAGVMVGKNTERMRHADELIG